MAITELAELEKIIGLTDDEKAWNPEGPDTLPLLISDEIVNLLSVPAIRRQFVPTVQENEDTEGCADPQEERKHSGTERLVHRYSNRAAFKTTDRCFAYCRHCFRRRFTGHLSGPATEKEIEEAATYVKAHSEIHEVLLTGGDLFTLSDNHIERLLSIFRSICPSVILRLCTRAVAVYPERFTDSLMGIIRKYEDGAPMFLMTQFNHPAELTDKAVEAVAKFVDIGIPAFNQSVLLKGVNDDEKTLIELSDKLLMARIKPYYLFQGDPVRGTAHLRVDIERGLEIEKNIRHELSGLGMPQYTADLPGGGGKVILTHTYLKKKTVKDGKARYIFTTPDGEERSYPD
ncbi:MAG: KamA family radical SAM protein [Spirochaetes bacterium]|uniref:KamA family radical SAM protein n=1 Tax=Candidatus Ornithospirochaeta stercoripullorum TaxID=2840899 RepID=A0A9D9H656_9SPIO|nr:KamA family radical SAM protein [Candidatus Ornithospirochaeta stercoripullorum]